MNELYKETADIIKGLVGYYALYFDDALEIKCTPHDFDTVRLWAVCLQNDCSLDMDVIYMMDGEQNWFELETGNERAEAVLNSLYQRVQTIHKLYKTNSDAA